MALDRPTRTNPLDARQGTGPKTEAGDDPSRRDGSEQEPAVAGVVPPEGEEEAVRARVGAWRSSLQPFNDYELWLAERIAVAAVRVERCEWLERALRQRLTARARNDWDEDRRIAVEKLGARLARNPGFVTLELQRSLQGCDWLLERWHGLERTLDLNGGWTEEQRRLALDMLGTPKELRDGILPLVPEHDWEALRARKQAVRAEIARLERRRSEVLEARDQAERRAAASGEAVEADPGLARIRRYEVSCHRRHQWALKQLTGNRPASDAPPVPRPEPPQDGPTTVVGPSPTVVVGALRPERDSAPRGLGEPPPAVRPHPAPRAQKRRGRPRAGA